MQPEQLALQMRLNPQADLGSFVAGPNQQALGAVEALVEGRGEPFVYVWGRAGSGRSHLLAGASARLAQQHAQVVYLPLAEHRQLAPEICAGLEQAELVCLDDVDAIAGLAAWEQALFGLFNRLRDAGKRLLVTAAVGSAALPLVMPDLRSRMAWGLAYQLLPLDDVHKQQVLRAQALTRGLELPDEVSAYLLRHYSRELVDLVGLLDRLDQASLVAQRRLTLPFVRQHLRL